MRARYLRSGCASTRLHRPRNAKRIAARKKHPTCEHIHSYARKEDERLLTATRRHKASRSPLVFTRIAEEPDKSAKRYPVEGKFSLADLADRERGRWVPYTKFLHLYTRQLRCDEVPELVDDYEERENRNNEKDCHAFISLSFASNAFSNSSFAVSVFFCSSSFRLNLSSSVRVPSRSRACTSFLTSSRATRNVARASSSFCLAIFTISSRRSPVRSANVTRTPLESAATPRPRLAAAMARSISLISPAS